MCKGRGVDGNTDVLVCWGPREEATGAGEGGPKGQGVNVGELGGCQGRSQ